MDPSLYNISVTKGSLALSAVLLAMSPVFVLFLAAIFFHEPITRHKLTCVTLALIGCVLVSGVLESNGLSWSITEFSAEFWQAFSMLYMES